MKRLVNKCLDAIDNLDFSQEFKLFILFLLLKLD